MTLPAKFIIQLKHQRMYNQLIQDFAVDAIYLLAMP